MVDTATVSNIAPALRDLAVPIETLIVTPSRRRSNLHAWLPEPLRS